MGVSTPAQVLPAVPGPKFRSGCGGQRDLVAETLQAFHRLPSHPVVVAMVEGLHAKVDSGWLPCEPAPEVYHKRMNHDHRGTLCVYRPGHPAILGAVLRRLRWPCRLSRYALFVPDPEPLG
ncbi:MAG: hypothetical protein M0Z53_06195 [Thermaerobacter sp.]|nr:hypothetical protein [Thermaerobacter sp.]